MSKRDSIVMMADDCMHTATQRQYFSFVFVEGEYSCIEKTTANVD